MRIELEANLIDWEDVENPASEQHRISLLLNGMEVAVIPVVYQRPGWCPASLAEPEDTPAFDHALLMGATCPRCGGVAPSTYSHGDDRSDYESEVERIITETLGPIISGRLVSNVPLGVTT